MITKNQIKLIKSLSLKKNRDKHNLFIAEGPKIVDELLKSEITLKTLYSTSENYTSIDRSIMINSLELKKSVISNHLTTYLPCLKFQMLRKSISNLT